MLTSCVKENPNVNKTGKDELEVHTLNHAIDTTKMRYSDLIYVPIYSDIYVTEQNQKNLLAATLSVRNTSLSDSLFISKIDYYNTEGSLVRSFITKPISLQPMGTLNYVIEKEDNTGGSGANFVVELSAVDENTRPILQAVMIGENGTNQGFAFSTDGYSIKKKKKN